MKSVISYLSDTHACGKVRVIDPAEVINQRSKAWNVYPSMRTYESDIYGGDVLLFECGCKPQLYKHMRKAQRNGVTCIYEIDDNWFECPEMFDKMKEYYEQKDIKDIMKRFMEDADLVTCTTEELAHGLLKHVDVKEIMVVNNAINGELWDPSWRKRTDEGFIIGWMASPSHAMDVELVSRAFCEIFERYKSVRVVTVGALSKKTIVPKEYHDRIESYKWMDCDKLPSIMSNFDIGICPLVRSPWNDCKSEVKWTQYAALGVPVICSDVPAYSRIQSAYKPSSNDAQGWYDAMVEMIESVELRASISDAGRKEMLDNYDLRSTYIRWCDAFDKAKINKG